jgi:adenine deaminase
MNDWSEMMMFCSDDKHPDSLEIGHINLLCERAVAAGVDVFKVLQAACINPVMHYKLDVGLLRMGDAADFILVKDLTHFNLLETYINGMQVANNGESFIERVVEENAEAMNRFDCRPMTAIDFEKLYQQEPTLPVIEALDGQLITNRLEITPTINDGKIIADTANDVLKIAVINRYYSAPVAVAFIKNFGLQKGAIASTVAHDSHNIVVVGCDDESMARAANLVIDARGGVSATDGLTDHILALPVAGLMSAADGYDVAKKYTAIDRFTKDELGATLASPFMTLSFMALLVIPHLKLSDKGLFDGDTFSFV